MSRLAAVKEALASWAPGSAPAATWLLPELRELLNAQFVGTYRPAATNAGWSLDFMHGDGERAEDHIRVFRSYVDELPRSERFLSLGNPHFVEFEQRNRVMFMRDLASRSPSRVAELTGSLFRALGIFGHDQLRLLVCDGPTQLAWLGATREEPFTEREAAVLRRLRKPLQERLRLERRLAAPGLHAAALETTLEALRTAAFLVGPGGAIEVANRLGLELLERDRWAVMEAIRLGAQPRKGDATEFSMTRISVPGWPTYTLAIQNEGAVILNRVLIAQAKWRLSVRQTRVLELVTNGASNKEIAATLACAEATVENHVTELFRRSGARSRAGLVGRLLVL
jgi:DNA-binding CsgD family transcriptional regulator